MPTCPVDLPPPASGGGCSVFFSGGSLVVVAEPATLLLPATPPAPLLLPTPSWDSTRTPPLTLADSGILPLRWWFVGLLIRMELGLWFGSVWQQQHVAQHVCACLCCGLACLTLTFPTTLPGQVGPCVCIDPGHLPPHPTYPPVVAGSPASSLVTLWIGLRFCVPACVPVCVL